MTTLQLDERDERQPRRHEDGGLVKFGMWLLPLFLASIVSYFTAQISSEKRVTAVETAEKLHFEEVQRSLARIERVLESMQRPRAEPRYNNHVETLPDTPVMGRR